MRGRDIGRDRVLRSADAHEQVPLLMPGAPVSFVPWRPPPDPEPMTIYDLLRRLVERGAWHSEEERSQAVALIGNLERVNALGTQASVLHTTPKGES